MEIVKASKYKSINYLKGAVAELINRTNIIR